MDLSRMKNWLFPTWPRVIERKDNFSRPCGYNVVMTIPDDVFDPEHVEILCFMPDGVNEKNKRRAEIITAIPEMLDRIGDHCELCADCDWMNNPDQECCFGRLWKRLRGAK